MDFQLLEDLVQQTSVEQPPFSRAMSMTQFAQAICTTCSVVLPDRRH